jgi:bifunctional ADP-heptose synthase (sugar kinase/adenylyltransferase)
METESVIMPGKSILVVGDSCSDVFVYCNTTRLSPESPVPILNPITTKTNNGMAGGVYDVLSYYNNKSYLCKNRNNIVKIRYIDQKTNHYFFRIDVNDRSEETLTPDKLEEWIRLRPFIGGWDSIDCIVISDYNKGFLNDEIIYYLSNKNKPSFLDSKRIITDYAKDITYIKINEKEFNNNINNCSFLKDRKNVIITLGENGAMYNGINIPVKEKVEVFELSGAGDVFFASLISTYRKTKNIIQSIEFANTAASYSVSKRGTNFADKGFKY